MDFLIKLWNQLLGQSVDNKTLLAREQKRLTELQAATVRMKERRKVREELIAARKACEELEVDLGKRKVKPIVYIAGLGGLLIIILLMKSCMGC